MFHELFINIYQWCQENFTTCIGSSESASTKARSNVQISVHLVVHIESKLWWGDINDMALHTTQGFDSIRASPLQTYSFPMIFK